MKPYIPVLLPVKKMKTKLIYGLFFLLLACGSNKKKSQPLPLYEVIAQEADGGARILFFEFLTEANEIKMLQNDPLLQKKIKSANLSSCYFVLLNHGEKETTGYRFEIDQASETKDSIFIQLKEIVPTGTTTPEKDIYYTPFTVLKINSKKPIRIN